jgi:hypothetical protein
MKIKAKDLKVGDKFIDGRKVVETELVYRVQFDDHSFTYARDFEELELVDPSKPEVYTVADIEVDDMVDIEKGSVTGLFKVAQLDPSRRPLYGVDGIVRVTIFRGALKVTCLLRRDMKIKRDKDNPLGARWIVECI